MISVIIPTYNEEENIKAIIQQVWRCDAEGIIREIIISDGGSMDSTVSIAKSEGVKVVISPKKGRSAQMNYGASFAKEGVLYFLHADTHPPHNFTSDIKKSIGSNYEVGCFMLSFDHDHWFLKTNCWFTRFDVNAIRFGDQSLFVKKEKFEQIGGFCEKHVVLEDQDIIKRLRTVARFAIIKKPVVTSARKYLENGIYKTQLIFFIIYIMYRLGFSQQKLVSSYRRLIRENKI